MGHLLRKKNHFAIHLHIYQMYFEIDSNFSVVDDLKFLNIYVNGVTGSINNLSSVCGFPILIFIKSSSIIFNFIEKEIWNMKRI